MLIASTLFIGRMGIGRSVDRCMIAVSGRLGRLGSLLGPLEPPSTEVFSLGGRTQLVSAEMRWRINVSELEVIS